MVITDPYEEADEDEDEDEDGPTSLRSIEASARPVEMYWKANPVIARIPGVKVYAELFV